jgi:hypothetical protein
MTMILYNLDRVLQIGEGESIPLPGVAFEDPESNGISPEYDNSPKQSSQITEDVETEDNEFQSINSRSSCAWCILL